LAKFGTQVLVGDLVVPREQETQFKEVDLDALPVVEDDAEAEAEEADKKKDGK